MPIKFVSHDVVEAATKKRLKGWPDSEIDDLQTMLPARLDQD